VAAPLLRAVLCCGKVPHLQQREAGGALLGLLVLRDFLLPLPRHVQLIVRHLLHLLLLLKEKLKGEQMLQASLLL